MRYNSKLAKKFKFTNLLLLYSLLSYMYKSRYPTYKVMAFMPIILA